MTKVSNSVPKVIDRKSITQRVAAQTEVTEAYVRNVISGVLLRGTAPGTVRAHTVISTYVKERMAEIDILRNSISNT